ncbi:odorant receptor Or2-like [Tribolium madens]|uniref:odorant receptor Or2-like n=1 Tax=Tribolium madens TaxID=41895 RepID=UPI001CF73979|nr:odorant receptor Or2-like [Tribolium madens]
MLFPNIEVKRFQTKAKDPLHFLYASTFGLFRLKFIKFVAIFTFVFHSVISVAFFSEILYTFDANLLIRYGPLIFIFSNGVMAVAVFFYLERDGRLILRQGIGRLWSFDSSSNLYKRINLESKYILQAVYFNNFLAACLVFFLLPAGGQSDKVLYGINLFGRFLPSQRKILTQIYYCTLPVLAYMVTVNPYLLLYGSSHIKFQVCYMNELLVKMARQYKDIDYNLLRNEKYQKNVTLNLKNCIRRHTILKYMDTKLNNLIRFPLLVVMGLSVVFLISLLFLLIVSREDVYIPSFGAILAFGTVTNILAVYSGQEIINESLKCLTCAGTSRWTSWNFSNRKMLVILMTNAQKPFIIQSPFFVFDFAFVIKALKFVSSVCGLFFEVARRRDLGEL